MLQARVCTNVQPQGLPETGKQLDHHVEPGVLVEFEQGCARLAALEQERVPVGVEGE
jgi:hypothetical protein